jgi:hypothetical protein
MFILKVTKQNGSIEQSDFSTEQECLDWKQHLFDIGYVNDTCLFEIDATQPSIADISPRQIRMALLIQGLTESMIDEAISGLSSPQKEQAQIAWKYSTSFKRDNEAVEIIGALLSLNSAQLDVIWIGAKDL